MELGGGQIYKVEAFNLKVDKRKLETYGGKKDIICKKEIWYQIVRSLIYMANSITRPIA